MHRDAMREDLARAEQSIKIAADLCPASAGNPDALYQALMLLKLELTRVKRGIGPPLEKEGLRRSVERLESIGTEALQGANASSEANKADLRDAIGQARDAIIVLARRFH